MKYLPVLVINLIIILLGLLVFNILSNKQSTDKNYQQPEKISWEEQSNSDGEVDIKVKPKSLISKDTNWDFEIVINTHSVELDNDLLKDTKVLDDQGREYSPLSFSGSPPGGHHRSGVLTFKSVETKKITLKILNIGETKERSFSWEVR